MTSIIVLCRDRWRLTRRCLDAVRRHTAAGSYELLVYDNASSDATPAGLRRASRGWPELRVERNERNLSFAEANNRGLRAARGRRFVLLNNDALVGPGWLEGLLLAASKANASAVGPMTDHQAPPSQIARPFRSAGSGRFAEAEFLGGFCILLEREAVERTGLLDERFVWGWEDMDYCLRLRQAGLRLGVATDVFVAHAGSRTLAGMPPEERERLDRENRRLILAKWLDERPLRRDLRRLYAALPAPWHRLGPGVSLLLPCAEAESGAACLASLRRAGGLEDCEVLAIPALDDAALPGRLARAGRGIAGFRVLAPARSVGQGAALAKGFESAAGERVAAFDDRARFEAGWLAALEKSLRSLPGAGAARFAGQPQAGWLALRGELERAGAPDERFSGAAALSDWLARLRQAGSLLAEAEGTRVRLLGRESSASDRRLAGDKWSPSAAAAEVAGSPDLSILFLCRGGESQARQSLAAARSAFGAADAEFLPVILDPPPGAWRRLARLGEDPRVRPLGPWGEKSAAAAFNRAAPLARGRRVAFLGDGVELEAPRELLALLGGFDERFPGDGCLEDLRLRAELAGLKLALREPSAERAARGEANRLADCRVRAAKWLDPALGSRARSGPRPAVSIVALFSLGGDASSRLRRLLSAARSEDFELLAAFRGRGTLDQRACALAEREPRLRLLGPWPDGSPYASFNRAAALALADRLVFVGEGARLPSRAPAILLRGPRLARAGGGGRPFAGLAASRELLERLSGFDERFAGPLGAWDLERRAARLGVRAASDGSPSSSAPAPEDLQDRRLAAREWFGPGGHADGVEPPAEAGLRPRASVVVLCPGGPGGTLSRLAELRRALGSRTDHEVLAAALAAPAATAAALRGLERSWPRLRFLGEFPATPYAHALNLACEAALGEHLVFLRGDAAPRAGFLERALRAAAEAAAPGVCAPGFGAPRDLAEHFVLIPRRVFAELGGFDRRFERELWARDFCFRAMQRGFELVALEPGFARNGARPDGVDAAHDRGLFFGKWSGHPLFEAGR